MRANFVDRLLARVDGELAPIWITEILTTDTSLAGLDFEGALTRLVDETHRLRLAWDSSRADWVTRERSTADLRAAVRRVQSADPRSLVSELLREPIDLARDLPLRLTLAECPDGASLAVIQLHHAIGDARSFMHLNRRFLDLLSGRARPEGRLGDAAMSDARAIAGVARRPGSLLNLLDARHRVLARRGQSLQRRGDEIGRPILVSLRAPLEGRFAPAERSGLFFAALLAGMVAHDAGAAWDAPIRLRVPVDLRASLGIGPTLENACSAIPVELPGDAVRALAPDPAGLGRLVPDALARHLEAGVAWATLVECLVVSRAASTAMMRTHVRPDLIAPRRANTMVTTYVGTVDRYFEGAPFPIRTLRTHTPTWGANGFSFGGALVINATSFEGIWTREDLVAFVEAMARFLSRHHGLSPEILV